MTDLPDIIKTNAINGAVIGVTWTNLETILSITLLLLSIVYTAVKLIKTYKDK